jgi:hypothetical protein
MTRRARHAPLTVCPLEERLAPAYNLLIDGDAVGSTNVTHTSYGRYSVFKATGALAVLDVDDIEDALAVGDVFINSGESGSENGVIDWPYSSDNDDLEYFGAAARRLTIETLPTAPGGRILLRGTHLDLGGNVDLTIQSRGQTATFNHLSFADGTTIRGAQSVVLDAGGSDIVKFGASIEATGDVSVSGRYIIVPAGATPAVNSATGDVAISATTELRIDGDGLSVTAPEGDVTFACEVDLPSGGDGLTVYAPQAALTFTDDVLGGSALTLEVTSVAFGGVAGTSTLPLTDLHLDAGTLTFSKAAYIGTLHVGDGSVGFGALLGLPAVLGAAAATVTADVVVKGDGWIAPGGLNAVGTTNVKGDVTFVLGHFAPDLDGPVDHLSITGNLTIQRGDLSSYYATGALSSTGPVTLIHATGLITGQFDNTLGEAFVCGSDAIQITGYNGGDVTIAQAPGAPGGKATGYDPYGTEYRVRLTGPGEVAVAQEGYYESLVLRGTTVDSKLSITCRASKSDPFAMFNSVIILGALGTLSAPTSDIGSRLWAQSSVRRISLHDYRAEEPITVAGGTADRLVVTAHNINGGVLTPGRLERLSLGGAMTGDVGANSIGFLGAAEWSGDVSAQGKVDQIAIRHGFTGSIAADAVGTIRAGDLSASVTTGSIGKVVVSNKLSRLVAAPPWVVDRGVGTVQAGTVSGWDLTASYLNHLVVRRDLQSSKIKLVGNTGFAGDPYALKSVTVGWTVSSTTFDVRAGHVGSFVVGRFLSSSLYLDYTPTVTFNTGGTFNTSAGLHLDSFRTTAATLGDDNNPLNYAFKGSQIAAHEIGSVVLSGLDASASRTQGIKYRMTGVVRVRSCSDASVPLNQPLAAGALPVAGDFYVLDV